MFKSLIASFASFASFALGVLVSTSAQAVEFRNDVPKATQDQMKLDLEFMKTLTGAKVSPLHQQVFGPMTAGEYGTWFESRVKSVAFDPNDDSGAVAYVQPFIDAAQMVLTGNFVKFDHPAIARMMIVYHEARHTEAQNDFWGHATCPTPFRDEAGADIKSLWTGLMLQGLPACDSFAVGAYGSSVVLLKNIQKNCDACNEKVKMDAGLFGDDQMKRVTSARAREALKQDLYVP